MSVDGQLADRLSARARQVVLDRLRTAVAHQAAVRSAAADIDPPRLERLVREAATTPGPALWRRALAQAAMDELGVGLAEALAHPALAEAPAAPAEAPAAPAEASAAPVQAADPSTETALATEPDALRVSAVHMSGIESLRAGERDLELRLSADGLDVLKRSTGVAIGRLQWTEIVTIEVPPGRRGLRGRRRPRELHIGTDRGQAQFELPGLTDTELTEQLEPLLARLRRS